MQILGPGKSDALAAIEAGEELCGKGPGDPGQKRAELEALTTEMANTIRGYNKQEHIKETERSDCSLFTPPQTTPIIHYSVLDPTKQERC